MTAMCQRWYSASRGFKLLSEQLLGLHPPIIIIASMSHRDSIKFRVNDCERSPISIVTGTVNVGTVFHDSRSES
jgi:hypothetical protein